MENQIACTVVASHNGRWLVIRRQVWALLDPRRKD